MDKALLGKIRTRYFTCVLYPNNPYHCEILQYWKQYQTGFYIIHEKGSDLVNVPYAGFVPEHVEDSGKNHIHVFLEFKNARTASGLIKSMPVVRYYKNEQTKQFFTVYDIPYISLPVQEDLRHIVEYFEPITDTHAYALYMIHQDFTSVALGKKQYSVQDIKMLNSDRSYLERFYETRQFTDSDCLDIVSNLWECSQGDKKTFLQLLQLQSSEKPLKYVQSHAYFIEKYILNRNEVNIND